MKLYDFLKTCRDLITDENQNELQQMYRFIVHVLVMTGGSATDTFPISYIYNN